MSDALTFFKENKDALQGLQAFMTAVGILVGGISAYIAFGRKREKFPRAKIKHHFELIPLDAERRIFRIQLEAENIGDTLVEVQSVLNRIQQVLPLAETNTGLFSPDSSDVQPEIPWPMIAERKVTFPEGTREIEPKETDEMHFDYILGREVEVVLVYSYILNAHKKRDPYASQNELGWMRTETVNLEHLQFMTKPNNSGQNETRQGSPKAQPSQTTNQGGGTAQGVAKPAPDTVSTPKTK
jgi:hypothetical protein